MDIRETRRERLLQLLREQKGKGKQRSLGQLIGKAPAQISQWVNRTRTITEDTAREIEAKARKPAGWMDLDPAAPTVTGHYAPTAVHARDHHRTQAGPPVPPSPPPDFSDRRLVSESDWALLQDVKTAATEDELAAIRERAAVIERKVSERLAAVAATGKAEPGKPD